MNDKINNTGEEDFNIDELLGEEEDSPVEEVHEEQIVVPKKKSTRRPKTVTNEPEESDSQIEIANAKKDLSNMEWQPLSQPAYDGYQNIKTGEVIDSKEAIRRCLCYAQEAARNSR